MRWGIVALSWVLFGSGLLLGWLSYDLPDFERLYEINRRYSVTLVTADNRILATYGDLYGEEVRLGDLPAYVPRAILATEDRRFYSHFGLDLQGIARAVYVNWQEGRVVQGGSTITQQLAKNAFLTPEKSIRRKGQEALLALWLESRFSKDQILEFYINRVYLGSGTYGLDAAARKFFGRPARKITLYQAAMLAGMLKAPAKYNPFSDPEAADERARLVLKSMVDFGVLPSEQAAKATAEAAHPRNKTNAMVGQYFADWVVDELPSYIGYIDRDLIVVTTLDRRMQAIAEVEMKALLEAEGEKSKVTQGALVSMTFDGAVRALVGGKDYNESQFNRASQAMRQPGSAFKAFVFLAAMEKGYNPGSTLIDQPVAIKGWRPSNYDGRFRGAVSLREAFARSLNSVAVQLSEAVGRNYVRTVANRLGITSDLMAGPSIALGASEVKLVELAGAYGAFANRGFAVWPRGIAEIRDHAGNVLWHPEGSGPARVIKPQQVSQMLDMMISVVKWGTGRAADPGRPAAGKTGTSTDYRDAWFIGFTPELLTGVWFGNDNSAPMEKITGGSLPARLWKEFTMKALQDVPITDPWGVMRGEAEFVAASGSSIEGAAGVNGTLASQPNIPAASGPEPATPLTQPQAVVARPSSTATSPTLFPSGEGSRSLDQILTDVQRRGPITTPTRGTTGIRRGGND